MYLSVGQMVGCLQIWTGTNVTPAFEDAQVNPSFSREETDDTDNTDDIDDTGDTDNAYDAYDTVDTD